MSTNMYRALVLMTKNICARRRRIKKTRKCCHGSIISYSEMNSVNRSTH